ncbi:MAG TPA: hypothetical protein VJ183_01420 [Chloroflexia bacterium]|nr:hypothetical protein [Chloroflexia bacterium]
MTYELFTVGTQGDAGWAHGQVLATGRADLSLEAHRGFDLSASVDLEAAVGGEVGKGLKASVQAGAAAGAGLSVKAAFPLDLFTVAGVVARVRAQAAASAFLRASVSLDSAVFSASLKGKLSGTWLELVDIFLSELSLGAGLWGKVAVAAEAVGEAALVGSLVGENPGFTCSFQYAVGYGAGAGMDFKVNFGLANPPRFFARMADRLLLIIEREVRAALSALDSDEQALALEVLSVLRLALPLAYRAIFDIGVTLATPPTPSTRSSAATAVSGTLARSFIREGQTLLSRALFELALRTLGDLLGEENLGTKVGTLTAVEADSTLLALASSRESLRVLISGEPPAEGLLPALVALLDQCSDLAKLIPDDQREKWEDRLALAWAVGVMITRTTQESSPAGNGATPFDASPVDLHSSNLISKQVSSRLGKEPDAALTTHDAMEFVLLNAYDYLQEITASSGDFQRLFTLLFDICGIGSQASLAAALFKDLSTPDAATASALAGRIGSVLGPVLEKEVLPRLIATLEANGNAELAEVVHTVVRPALLSITHVLLQDIPKLDTASTSQVARLLREKISAVLLQSLTRYLITSTNIILDDAISKGVPLIHGVAQDIRQGGAKDIVSVSLATLASATADGPFAIITPTADDLADLIDLSAATMEHWNSNSREEWLALMSALMSLGLTTGDEKLDELWSAVNDSPTDPPSPLKPQLETLLRRVADDVWKFAGILGLTLLKIVHRHFELLDAPVVATIEGATRSLKGRAKAAVAKAKLAKKGDSI